MPVLYAKALTHDGFHIPTFFTRYAGAMWECERCEHHSYSAVTGASACTLPNKAIAHHECPIIIDHLISEDLL